MSHDDSQNDPPEIVEDVVEVSSLVIGSLIDSLRRSFTTRGQKQQGDYLMDQSRELLEQHLDLIPPAIQRTINNYYAHAEGMRTRLGNDSGTPIQRLLEARKYRRISRQAYKITKRASEMAVKNARTTPGVDPGNHFGSGSTRSHPFSDSRVMSNLTNVPVDGLQDVEMTTYQTEDTGEAAVVFDLHSRHAPTQHIVATFPTVVFSGKTDWDDRVDRSETDIQAPTSLPPISGPMSPSETPEAFTETMGLRHTLSQHLYPTAPEAEGDPGKRKPTHYPPLPRQRYSATQDSTIPPLPSAIHTLILHQSPKARSEES
ncbi:hypothetical protein BC827DRAFT_1268957 [Russula dissimulans]|nr:hypothetical protein BC827DRAFT_1268957 [Russula dissimulans]